MCSTNTDYSLYDELSCLSGVAMDVCAPPTQTTASMMNPHVSQGGHGCMCSTNTDYSLYDELSCISGGGHGCMCSTNTDYSLYDEVSYLSGVAMDVCAPPTQTTASMMKSHISQG